MSAVISARRVAFDAGRLAMRDPLSLLVLLGVHALFFVALWVTAAWSFGPALADRPSPTLFDLAALALAEPAGLRRLLTAWAALGTLYLLGGAFVAGALLARLQRRPSPLRVALRHLGSLLLLRLIALAAGAMIAVGGYLSLRWVVERSLALADERLQVLLLAGAALPVLLALLVCALLLQYGQPLLVDGCRLRGLGRALALIHRRPIGATGLYLSGWMLWLAIALLGLAGLPAPLAALVRVGVHLWSVSAALLAVRAWGWS
jgi:hypothetical protein